MSREVNGRPTGWLRRRIPGRGWASLPPPPTRSLIPPPPPGRPSQPPPRPNPRANERRAKKTPAQRSRLRLSLIGMVVAGLFAALFGRLYYLQVLHRPSYAHLAVQDSVRTAQTPAPRGLILDRSGKPLVENRTMQVVTLTRYQADQHRWVVPRLARVLHMPAKQVRAEVLSDQFGPYTPVPIQTGVPITTIIYLREHAADFPGVSAQLEALRTYPYGDTLGQTLGYLTPIDQSELKAYKSKGYQVGDLFGQSGLEGEYESYLRGRPGTEKLEVTPSGQVVSILSQTPAAEGDSVQTTIDLGLQMTLQNDLARQIQALRAAGHPAPGGAGVVMDPQNGQILAIASYPTYDPDVWVGGISQAELNTLDNPANNEPMLNRAIQALTVPGSTFKLATATAALNSGLITPSYIYDDTGSFKVPNCTAGLCTLHNAGGEVAGPINVTQALTASIDDFFYNLGYLFYVNPKYGPTPIQNTANAYGLGELTGIDLPGEVQGRVDSLAVRKALCAQAPKAYTCPPSWAVGDQLEMAFGQGATVVTPIEMADAYATFANGGTRYQPQIGHDIVNPKGQVVKTFAPKVTGHVPMSPANHQAVLQGLLGAVQSGSGTSYATFRGFDFSKMDVAGKTGTGDNNHPNQPDGWFAAIAGRNINHPQYVVAVSIEEAGYGANTGAPVARDVLQYLTDNPPAPLRLPKPPQVLVPATAGKPAPGKPAAGKH